MRNNSGRGQVPGPRGGGRGVARGGGRGDGRGRGAQHRQVQQVTDEKQFEELGEDPLDEYLSDLLPDVFSFSVQTSFIRSQEIGSAKNR